jgi:hypothetical protein
MTVFYLMYYLQSRDNYLGYYFSVTFLRGLGMNFSELRYGEVHDGVKVCIAPPR